MLEIIRLDGRCVKETFAIRLRLKPSADTAQECRGFSYSKGLTVRHRKALGQTARARPREPSSYRLQDAPHWHVDPTAHLVRRCHRLCLADVLRRHLAHAGEARQAHGTDKFVLQDLQHAHNAVRTTSSEPPGLHS